MAKIFYSMAGEGRGHAARVASLVEHLRTRHQLVLLAPDEAYDFLAPRYDKPEFAGQVRVERIPGMRFKYSGGKLNLAKTIAYGLKYRYGLYNTVRQIRELMEDEQPHLAVCDFEAALPRAARAEGLPLLSLDHQHFMTTYDLSTAAWGLRFHAWLMGFAVRAHCTWQVETVVSAFYFPPLRGGAKRVTQVGPLLRADITAAQTHQGGYILSYLRQRTSPEVLDMITSLDMPVKIYGLGSREPVGNATFHEIDSKSFVRDLAGCECYLGAAGNQTLGEAVYLGKPVMALPERFHHEQRINAHFIREMGVGDWRKLEAVTQDDLTGFLERLPEYRDGLKSYAGKIDGTAAALEAIERNLPLKHSSGKKPVKAERSSGIYDALSPATS